MEVESEDDEDEREDRHGGQPSQPDQDTQVQDMDEVGRRHPLRTWQTNNKVTNLKSQCVTPSLISPGIR